MDQLRRIRSDPEGSVAEEVPDSLAPGAAANRHGSSRGRETEKLAELRPEGESP